MSRVGHFDALSKNSYLTDNKGRWVYYPLGWRRSGYIVPDEQTARSIDWAISKAVVFGVFIAIILTTVFGPFGGYSFLALVLVLMLIVSAAYLQIFIIVRGLERTRSDLSRNELKRIRRARRIYHAHTLAGWRLPTGFIVGPCIFGMGQFLLYFADSWASKQFWAGIAATGLGVGIITMCAYFSRVRTTTRAPS